MQVVRNLYEHENEIPEDQIVSPLAVTSFKSPTDVALINKIMPYEGTAQAVQMFEKRAPTLSDYGYWFLLSTLWVSYSGFYPLHKWRWLFQSRRPHKAACLMKPYELRAFEELPESIPCFRAHRAGETEWLSYTLSQKRAVEFMADRGNGAWLGGYYIPKSAVDALILRRGEDELVVSERP